MGIDLLDAEIGAVLATCDCAARSKEELAQYARASGDLNPLHLDEAFARKAGFDNLVVHGMLNMAVLGRLLTDHFDPQAILNFSTRFEGVLTVGESTRLTMRLAGRDEAHAELALAMSSESGRQIVSARALVAL